MKRLSYTFFILMWLGFLIIPDQLQAVSFQTDDLAVALGIKDKKLAIDLKETKAISLADIPFIDQIPLGALQNVLGNVILQDLTFKTSYDPKTKQPAGLEITGTTQIFGTTVQATLRKTLKGLSLLIALPGDFEFVQLHPIFNTVNFIRISNGVFALSTEKYKDPRWGEIKKGINLVAAIAVQGKVADLVSKVGVRNPTLLIKGLIGERFDNVSLSVELPVNAIQIWYKNVGLMSDALQFTVWVKSPPAVQVPTAAMGIKTGLTVYLPQKWHITPINFSSELQLDAATQTLKVYGKVTGRNDQLIQLPIVPVKVGNLGIQGSLSPQAGYTLGIRSLGLGGTAQWQEKEISLMVNLDVGAANNETLIEGSIKGGFYLKDAVGFFDEMIKSVIKRDLRLSMIVAKRVPRKIYERTGIQDAKIYFASVDGEFLGRKYKKGVEISGCGSMLDKDALFDMRIKQDGLHATGWLQEFKLGPITFTGSGLKDNRCIKTGVTKGPSFSFIFNPFKKAKDEGQLIVRPSGELSGFQAQQQTHYDILEISPGASIDEVKRAYRALALRFHPDKFLAFARQELDEREPTLKYGGMNYTKQEAEEQFKKMNTAYESLSDPKKREAYDAQLSKPSEETISETEDTEEEKKPVIRDPLLKIFIDAFVIIPWLKTEAGTHINLTPKGGEFKVVGKLLNEFDATLEGKIDIDNLKKSEIAIDVDQTALSTIAQKLNTASHSIIESGRATLQESKRKAQDKLRRAQEQLREVRESFSALEELKERANQKVRECKEVSLRKPWKKTKVCARAAQLEALWAAKKVAYATAKTGVRIAERAVGAAESAVRTAATAGLGFVLTGGKALQLSGVTLEKGINIRRLHGRIAPTDLKKGQLPELSLEATVFGFGVNIKVQIDILKKPKELFKLLLSKIS